MKQGHREAYLSLVHWRCTGCLRRCPCKGLCFLLPPLRRHLRHCHHHHHHHHLPPQPAPPWTSLPRWRCLSDHWRSTVSHARRSLPQDPPVQETSHQHANTLTRGFQWHFPQWCILSCKSHLRGRVQFPEWFCFQSDIQGWVTRFLCFIILKNKGQYSVKQLSTNDLKLPNSMSLWIQSEGICFSLTKYIDILNHCYWLRRNVPTWYFWISRNCKPIGNMTRQSSIP